ncbi:hypothetical protein PUN28_015349 [Cardiocondyla obscurior]|uniref:Uncharacterized protein n=1 Tax=Cardiocondyla obscurior TaxID=286306 RepID=A0AAW2EUB2_9HYME
MRYAKSSFAFNQHRHALSGVIRAFIPAVFPREQVFAIREIFTRTPVGTRLGKRLYVPAARRINKIDNVYFFRPAAAIN